MSTSLLSSAILATFASPQGTVWELQSGRTAVDWLRILGVAWWALVVVVHVAFAIGVWRHASRGRPVFVAAAWWGLGTLVAGPLMAAAYWVIHVSTLAPGKSPPAPPRQS